ncbi:MAG: DNA-binding response regulator [Myxococcales bacterium]|nr:DNA-binding response regulator [Myxococcales bacterium]
MSRRILIVEDEVEQAGVLKRILTGAGFQTLLASTGGATLRLVREARPHLILLDGTLPDMPGLQVCRILKQDPELSWIPVVLLTRRCEQERILGLELGATDCVVKPFSTRELVLRVKAILKHFSPNADVRVLTLGPVTVDVHAARVRVHGAPIELTPIEYRLLVCLLRAQGKVFTREELLDGIWGRDAEVQDRTVDVHIMRLREKLQSAGEFVETVRGVGYRLGG